MLRPYVVDADLYLLGRSSVSMMNPSGGLGSAPGPYPVLPKCSGIDKAHRRRGVGHALVAAAADIADELGIEHVSVGVYPSLREASRFYARLGFAQVMVQRVVPTAMLRRRLCADLTTRRVDDLVLRRNRMRRPVPSQRLSRVD